MKKYLLLSFLMTLSTAWLMAQERQVTGKVTDAETGESLPGVNVIIEGTSQGGTTDFDGNYAVTVSGNSAVLRYTYVGYKDVTETVGARSVIDVQMGLDVTELGEVVVIGYGTQEKQEITSAVTTVDEEQFNNGNVNDPAQLLQGKVAGLSVVRPGGDPNESFQVRLRGLSTFGANSQPLVILDGVVGANLDNVDPNDIASINVLKDGSAAAIYGTRASAGVLIVTTKSGSSTSSSITYNSFVTIDQVANKIDVLSAEEFVAGGGTDYRPIRLDGNGNPVIDPNTGREERIGNGTDWFDELTGTGISHTHNLTATGSAGAGNNYSASINFRDNDGIVNNVNFNRLNARLNVRQSVLDGRMRFNVVGAINNRNQEAIDNSAFRYATIYNPTAPVFDDLDSDNDGPYFNRDGFDFFNPVAVANQRRFTDERKIALINGKVEFDILDNLYVWVNYSQENQSGLNGSYWSKFDLRGTGQAGNGVAKRSTFDNNREIIETTLNYEAKLTDNLRMDALLGASHQVTENEDFEVQVKNFLFDGPNFDRLDFGGVRQGGNTNAASGRSRDILDAAFARVNFNLSNTYFLSASVRREAYSGFGANNKVGNFPAVSAGVELGEIFDLGVIDNLKLRASYGVTGALPPFPDLALQIRRPDGLVDRDGDPLTTDDVFVVPVTTQNANPNLKWEEKREFNLGLDFVIADKLSGSIEYYTRNIKDIILEVPASVGAPNPFTPAEDNVFFIADRVFANAGELTSGGFEFAATYADVNLGKVTWSPSFNFTIYDRAVLTQIGIPGTNLLQEGNIPLPGATPGSPGQEGVQIIRAIEGDVIGNFYGPRFQGIDEQGRYVLSSTDPADYGIIGNGLPDGEFGFSNTFILGNFDLNFFLRGVFGHDIYNSYRGFYETRDAGSTTWNSVNTDKTDPRITSSPTFSDLYIEDGTFLRLDNAQIGYNLKLESKYFSNIRIYAAGQNLFTITNYSGIDPEVKYRDSREDNTFTAALAPGIERRNTYFTTRSYTLGVKFNIK